MPRRIFVRVLRAVVAIDAVQAATGNLDIFQNQIAHARQVQCLGSTSENRPRFTGNTANPNWVLLGSGNVFDKDPGRISARQKANCIARTRILERTPDCLEWLFTGTIPGAVAAGWGHENLPERGFAIGESPNWIARIGS